ncbi:unnamed protein product, partial [Polarella glacialis]
MLWATCFWQLLLAAILSCAAAKAAVPHFKWGQNKEQLFVSVMVRELDASSVSVALNGPGELIFNAKNSKGQVFALDLDLREDVKQDSMKWEVSARSDKWGIATVITLSKEHSHRWDLFVTDLQQYKGLLDKDWSREDQKLEPEEDTTVMDDNGAVIKLTEANLNKTIEKYGCLVVNIRFPWCSVCKGVDDQFSKAASTAKAMGKRNSSSPWRKAAFAYIDARKHKTLGRRFNANCNAGSCKHWLFTGNPSEVLSINGQYDEASLLSQLEKYLRPAVVTLKDLSEVDKLKAVNLTVVASFASKEPKGSAFTTFERIANSMRGDMVFAVAYGVEKDYIELWKPQAKEPLRLKHSEFGDDGTGLEQWLRARAMPLLQTYEWTLREKFEKMKLPVAR